MNAYVARVRRTLRKGNKSPSTRESRSGGIGGRENDNRGSGERWGVRGVNGTGGEEVESLLRMVGS
jgi:hypothetical protein